MRVSELADELDVPASAVLDQCQRFGIDAAWAGAELSGADVVVLRSELASAAPIDLTPTDPVDPPPAAPAAPEVPAAPAAPEVPAVEPAATAPAPRAEAPPLAGNGLPPTAVGSMPDLIDEVTPEVEPDDAGATPRSAGFGFAGPGDVGDQVRTVRHREPPEKRRFERSARTAVVAFIVGVVAYAASNFTTLPAVVVVLWLIAATAFVVCVLDAFRGRRHAQMHPDRTRGVWLATTALVLGIAGIVGLTASVMTVMSDDPQDAPLGLGDLESVQVARWGYLRTGRIMDNGWRQPARPAGSCWSSDDNRLPRSEGRVELSEVNRQVSCSDQHEAEVAMVFALNRDADSPYPGAEGVLLAAQRSCGPMVEQIVEKTDVTVELAVEYPTEIGWSDGDHDIACVLVTSGKRGALVS